MMAVRMLWSEGRGHPTWAGPLPTPSPSSPAAPSLAGKTSPCDRRPSAWNPAPAHLQVQEPDPVNLGSLREGSLLLPMLCPPPRSLPALDIREPSASPGCPL